MEFTFSLSQFIFSRGKIASRHNFSSSTYDPNMKLIGNTLRKNSEVFSAPEKTPLFSLTFDLVFFSNKKSIDSKGYLSGAEKTSLLFRKVFPISFVFEPNVEHGERRSYANFPREKMLRDGINLKIKNEKSLIGENIPFGVTNL